MACEDIHAALSLFQACTETSDGSRVVTHCLYPSFEPVEVYVYRFGDGYRVHDLGGARREAWLHGVDDVQMSRILNQEADKHQIQVEAGRLVATVGSPEWLFAAVVAVANVASNATRIAVDRVGTSSEDDLKERIEWTLLRNFPGPIFQKDYHFRGKSGKDHRFDFALRATESRTLLISAVAPHHTSISSKYVAFADSKIDGFDQVGRFLVYERPLDEPDASLLGQVADLVPLRSLEAGARRSIARWNLVLP